MKQIGMELAALPMMSLEKQPQSNRAAADGRSDKLHQPAVEVCEPGILQQRNYLPGEDTVARQLEAQKRVPESVSQPGEQSGGFRLCFNLRSKKDTSPYDAQIRGAQSNEAKNVTLEDEAVDMGSTQNPGLT